MVRVLHVHWAHDQARPKRKPAAVPPAMPQVWLEVVRGRTQERMRELRAAIYLLGSASDSDLVLGDPQFPASYAYILSSPVGIALRWLGEGPEPTLNGRAVTSHATLHNGDRLRAGSYEFRVLIQWPGPRRLEANADSTERVARAS